jgi:hypothetical protein
MRKIYIASLFLIIAGIFGIWRLTAWAGTTWQGVPNGCNSPNIATCNTDGVVWLRPNPAAAAPQSGGFNIGGDAAISDGKAIRVDKAGTSSLNFGNWADGNAVLNMSIAGNVNLTSHGLFTTPTLTAYQVAGTNSLCINGDCKTAWPVGGGGTVTSIIGGTGLDGGNITGAGTLSINAAYQLPQACAANQVPKYNAGTWICANDVDTNSGGDITDVTSVLGSGIAVTNSAGPIPQISISNTDSMGCAANQGRLWNGAAWACTSLPTVAASDAKYVFKAGDTMTGLLTVTVPWTVAGGKSIVTNGAADYGIFTQNASIGNYMSGVSYGVWGTGTGATGDGGTFIGNRYGVYAEERAAGGVAVYGKAAGIIVGTAGRFESTNIALDVRGRANFNDVIIDQKDFMGSTLTVTNNYAMGGTHWAGAFTANGIKGIGVDAAGYQNGIRAYSSGPGTGVGTEGAAVYGQENSGTGWGGLFENNGQTNRVWLGGPTYALQVSGLTKIGAQEVFGDLKMQAGWKMCFNNGAVPATDCIANWSDVTTNSVKKTGDSMTGGLSVINPSVSIGATGVYAAGNSYGVWGTSSNGYGFYGQGVVGGMFGYNGAGANGYGPRASLGDSSTAGQFERWNWNGSNYTSVKDFLVQVAGSQAGVLAYSYINTTAPAGRFQSLDLSNNAKYTVFLGDQNYAIDATGPSRFTGSVTLIGPSNDLIVGGRVTSNGEYAANGTNAGYAFSTRDGTAPTRWVWYSNANYARLYNQNIGDVMRIDSMGNVYIGSGTTGCLRDWDSTTIAGTCASDVRLKTDIKPLSNILTNYVKLQPVEFSWKKDGITDVGLIAQDVEKIFPDLVETDKDGMKSVSYNVNLQMKSMQAIKELKAQNDMLQAENTMLLRRLEALEAKVK